MHAQPNSGNEPDTDAVDQAVIGLLLDDGHPVWAVPEVVREIGDELVAREALRRLRGAGLVHQIDGGYVFASRAARRMVAICP